MNAGPYDMDLISRKIVLVSVTLLLYKVLEARANIARLVNPHANVSFNCTYNVYADKMRWSFLKADDDTWDIIFDARNHPSHEVKCNMEQKHCTIVIPDADINKAGRYRFEHGINGQPMTIACRYELVVGELQCQSNIRHSGVMIGENDCPVKPETFARSCSLLYSGNYNNSINFIWMKSLSEETIVRDKSLTGSIQKSDNGMKLSSVEDSVPVSNDMDNAILECRLEGESQIQSCKLPKISVQYLKSNSEKKLGLHSNNLKNMNCLVGKSQSMKCRYHWEIKNGDVKFEIHEQNLTSKHLITPGSYICQATCDFITGERCQLFGHSFDLLPHNDGFQEHKECPKNGYIIAFVITLCFALLLLNLGAIILFKRMRKNSRKNRKNYHTNLSEENSRAIATLGSKI